MKKGVVLEKFAEFVAFFFPVDGEGDGAAGEDEVFGDGHVSDEGEVLVDHADAEGEGFLGVFDYLFAVGRR